MKKLNLSLLFTLFVAASALAQLTWTNNNDFFGTARYISTGFAANGKGYMVGGRTISSPITYVKDHWEYDPATDAWTKKADFPSEFASGQAFSINGKGYIAGGQDNGFQPVNSTYEYDPGTNVWTSKANVPVNINGGFSFVINNIAYIGTGARTGANTSTTVYAYNPLTDVWSSKANYTGPSIVGGIGFSIGGFGYAGCGTNGSGILNNQFFKYDPINNSWSAVATFPGKPRFNPMAFELNGIAYVGGGTAVIGGNNYYALNDFYAYDAVANTWTPVPGLPGAPRQGGVTFVIDNAAYEVGGYDNDGDIYYKSVSKFTSCGQVSGLTNPTGHTERQITIYPNPSSNELNVKLEGETVSELSFEVTDVQGQLIKKSTSRLNNFSFSTSDLSNGVYLLSIKDASGNYTVKRFEVMR